MPTHQYKNKTNNNQDNMLLPEPNYPTAASSEHFNNLKTGFVKIILVSKEEMNKSLEEIKEKTKNGRNY